MKLPLELQAADALRRLVLDQSLKHQILGTPAPYQLFHSMARRYVAGETLETLIPVLEREENSGHQTTVDFMGESVKTEAKSRAALEEFLKLCDALKGSYNRSVSPDLSHIGLTADPKLCLELALQLAQKTQACDLELMVTMEGSDRTNAVLNLHAQDLSDLQARGLDLHDRLCDQFPQIGITVQARLHRTERDLEALLERPGRIRLVKGAFDETETVALRREDPRTNVRYLEYAKKLLSSGHPCSIGTRDAALLNDLHGFLQSNIFENYEFEMLYGLPEGQLERMHLLGHPTRLYLVYGREWILYLLNRLAEKPERLFQAVMDLGSAQDV